MVVPVIVLENVAAPADEKLNISPAVVLPIYKLPLLKEI
jgi:hypothetical protein